MTLLGLIAYVEDKFGAELSMLSHGVTILYSNFMAKKKIDERKPMSLKSIVETVAKKELLPSQKYLIFELIISDVDTDEEIEIPYLRLQLF